MFFWIPALAWATLMTVFIVLAVRWRKRPENRDQLTYGGGWAKENPWGAGVGSVATFGSVIVFFIMLFAANGSPTTGQRDLFFQTLVVQEDGNYVTSQLRDTDNFITFVTDEDGVTLAQTVNINDSITKLVVSNDQEPGYAWVQGYLDDAWIWPWFVERASWYEIRIPNDAVTLE